MLFLLISRVPWPSGGTDSISLYRMTEKAESSALPNPPATRPDKTGTSHCEVDKRSFSFASSSKLSELGYTFNMTLELSLLNPQTHTLLQDKDVIYFTPSPYLSLNNKQSSHQSIES